MSERIPGPSSAAEFDGIEVPPRVWSVAGYLPHGEVSLMQGNGGEGKTTLALQLGTAKSARSKWLAWKRNQAARSL
jgi:RecA-family ATPase